MTIAANAPAVVVAIRDLLAECPAWRTATGDAGDGVLAAAACWSEPFDLLSEPFPSIAIEQTAAGRDRAAAGLSLFSGGLDLVIRTTESSAAELDRLAADLMLWLEESPTTVVGLRLDAGPASNPDKDAPGHRSLVLTASYGLTT